ncbi:MAG: protein jag [Clostridia bacterium]|nr:protein jag [Clostridia bacterium]
MKKTFEATGKTREEAIDAGLAELNLTIGEVTVEDIEEGSKGLFGLFGSRPWRVRVTAIEEEKTVLDTHSLFADSLDTPVEKKQRRQNAEKKPAAPKKEKAEKTEKAEKPAAEKKEEKPAAEKKPAAKKQQKKPTEKKAPAEKKPVAPAEQKDPATAAGRAQSFLQELTQLMGVEVSVDVNTDEEGNVRVNMQGDSQGILIGRRGETLDALQYLTSLQVNKGRGEYIRVTLDTEGYRARREEALIRLANRMANRAVKTGRRVSMEPMNPYERRILHSALQGNPAVTTHSEGEEPNRHVVITVNKAARKAQENKAVETAEEVQTTEAE